MSLAHVRRARGIAAGLTIAAAAAISTTVGGQGRGEPPAVPRSLVDVTAPAMTCESLTRLHLDNTTIDEAVVRQDEGTTPASCRVTATVTHPPANDKVTIFLALPLRNWNGRFQGVGGGGFSGGSPESLSAPLAAGYAAGATDTGHTGGRGSFALDANGRLDWMLIRDNAYLGIHEMTVTGKAVAEAFYGVAPQRAYFNGCSTGGRQGLMEAQRYPADYDGVLAGAPAINWPKLHIEQMWAHVVMQEMQHVVPQCVFAAATEAAIAACDADDGVTDGLIDDPRRCAYDPKALAGTTASNCRTVTAEDAEVISRIWEGPRRRDGSFLWYGLPRGAAFSGVSNTGGTPLATRPHQITLDWWRYFLKQDPDWDHSTLDYAGYEQAWAQSVEQYGLVIGTDDPDLSAFRDRGGRIVMWHGQADPLIYPGGSIDYYERVQAAMGGAEKTADFMRFFLAPGVGHCGGGNGPAPTGAFEAVVRWVEDGPAPETLMATSRTRDGAVARTRPLCPFPSVARYNGTGSPDEAGNFTCRAD